MLQTRVKTAIHDVTEAFLTSHALKLARSQIWAENNDVTKALDYDVTMTKRTAAENPLTSQRRGGMARGVLPVV